MLAVKIVTGGTFPDATEYDEENVIRVPALDEATREAVALRRTIDILDEADNMTRLARVFPDGGIDFTPAARLHRQGS